MTTIDKTRKRLRDRLQQLTSNAGTRLNQCEMSSGGDAADIAFAVGDVEINSILEECDGDEIAKIRRALSRIDDGTYGVCEHCDCKIAAPRLQALPFTTTCINCQRRLEK